MNATVISSRIDRIFQEAWVQLPAQERVDAFNDMVLYGVSLIEVRDDGNAQRIDPRATLAHLQ